MKILQLRDTTRSINEYDDGIGIRKETAVGLPCEELAFIGALREEAKRMGKQASVKAFRAALMENRLLQETFPQKGHPIGDVQEVFRRLQAEYSLSLGLPPCSCPSSAQLRQMAQEARQCAATTRQETRRTRQECQRNREALRIAIEASRAALNAIRLQMDSRRVLTPSPSLFAEF